MTNRDWLLEQLLEGARIDASLQEQIKQIIKEREDEKRAQENEKARGHSKALSFWPTVFAAMQAAAAIAAIWISEVALHQHH